MLFRREKVVIQNWSYGRARCATYEYACRLQYTKLAIHMSPRWGLRYLVYPACYIHAAPLGLNAAAIL